MKAKPSTPRKSRHVARGGIIAAFGILLLITLGCMAKYRFDFLRQAQSAHGVVTRLNAGGSHPQIGFTTSSGETVSFPQGGMVFNYAVGDPAAVLYLPGAARQTASVDSFGALWGLDILLAVIAIVFLLVGVATLRGPRSQRGANRR